jgi:hypothetical protein
MHMQRVALLTATLIVSAASGIAYAGMPPGAELAADSQLASPGARLPAAGSKRPTTVPEGYVITPFGYFHPSCVRTLAKGASMLADGRVQRADGSQQAATTCNYPHFTRSGEEVSAVAANSARKSSNKSAAAATPEISGWLENANYALGSGTESFGTLIARWTVPPNPRANDGQTLFFFPGLEDIYDTESILQPVLTFFNGQWSIAGWNCCFNNQANESQPVNVSPGDEIYGAVTSNCAEGTLTCATYSVLILDMTTGEGSILANTPTQGQTFNWAFGGVLEPYYIVSCEDFPRDRKLTFEKIRVFDQNMRPVQPRWNDAYDSSDTPQCNYGVRIEENRVTLRY